MDRFLVVIEIIEMPMLLISRIFCRETQTSYNMKWLWVNERVNIKSISSK